MAGQGFLWRITLFYSVSYLFYLKEWSCTLSFFSLEFTVCFMSCRNEFLWDWEVSTEELFNLNSASLQLIVYRYYCNANLIELSVFVLSGILDIISISECSWHIWFIVIYPLREHFVQRMLATLCGSQIHCCAALSFFLLLKQNYFYVKFVLFGILPKNDVPPLP